MRGDERGHVDDGGKEDVVVERGRKQSGELLESVGERQEELFLHVRGVGSNDGVDVIHFHRHEKRDDIICGQTAGLVHVVLGEQSKNINRDRNTLQQNGLFFVMSNRVEQREDSLSNRFDILALNQ